MTNPRLVRVVCEGQTEEAFIKWLSHALLPELDLVLKPILLGGNVKCVHLRRCVENALKDRNNFAVTTFVDQYGLGNDWPSGYLASDLEAFLADQIASSMGKQWDSRRLRVHIQPHEFESLLFSDPTALARGVDHPGLESEFRDIRDSFPNPEAINNSRETSPSKRIAALVRDYDKVLMGVKVAKHTGLEVLERECPHFAAWVGWLRSLAI